MPPHLPRANAAASWQLPVAGMSGVPLTRYWRLLAAQDCTPFSRTQPFRPILSAAVRLIFLRFAEPPTHHPACIPFHQSASCMPFSPCLFPTACLLYPLCLPPLLLSLVCPFSLAFLRPLCQALCPLKPSSTFSPQSNKPGPFLSHATSNTIQNHTLHCFHPISCVTAFYPPSKCNNCVATGTA